MTINACRFHLICLFHLSVRVKEEEEEEEALKVGHIILQINELSEKKKIASKAATKNDEILSQKVKGTTRPDIYVKDDK